MSRDYQVTHDNLLLCAKKHFLKNGFEKAGIREICKAAGVTNGAFYNHFSDKEALFCALVDPVVGDIKRMYEQSVQQHTELMNPDDLKSVWQMSESTIILIIEYIYDHFELFRLLLMCSEGTKYAGFLDSVVCLEVNETLKFFNEFKSRRIKINDLDDNEWHMLIHSYYSSLAEIILHNYPKQSALKYARTISKFFSSGWKEVLGI